MDKITEFHALLADFRKNPAAKAPLEAYIMANLDLIEGALNSVKIIEARLPLYKDVGQINALKECIGSIKHAMHSD